MTAAEFAAIVREHTERALAPVLEANKALEMRILELETRPAVLGPPGVKGDPGLPGVGVASLLLSAEGRLVAHLTDGRTLDAGPVPQGIVGPPGPPGEQGERGENGLDGHAGADGVNGKDGAAGLNGKDGLPGLDGKDGRDGLDGKDGTGVMDAVLDRAGHLILTLSDGRTKDVGLVTGRDGLAGKDGAPGLNGNDGTNGLDGRDGATGLAGTDGRDGLNGKDGADGMTLDDVDLVCTESGWQFRVSAGGRTKDCPIPLPHHVGPWSAGASYAMGACASWDGGWWIAKQATSDQPGASEAWQLIVRRGKQGKDGRPGKDGRDLTPGNTPPLYG